MDPFYLDQMFNKIYNAMKDYIAYPTEINYIRYTTLYEVMQEFDYEDQYIAWLIEDGCRR